MNSLQVSMVWWLVVKPELISERGVLAGFSDQIRIGVQNSTVYSHQSALVDSVVSENKLSTFQDKITLCRLCTVIMAGNNTF